MNKPYLQSKVKSTGTAYLFWCFFGLHYAYLDRWGLQILYWISLGGLGIWGIIDLFTMSQKVERYNFDIFRQIEEIEKREKEEDHVRHMAMINAVAGQKPSDEDYL